MPRVNSDLIPNTLSMSISIFRLAFLCAMPITSVLGATYAQTDSHQGSGFLNSFGVQSIPDPTNGRVNFVDGPTAMSENLTFSSGDTFILRADATTVLDPNGPGRNSVRLISNKQYTTSVMVFNMRHMPQGCGTWPAVWTVGEDWPNQASTNGEIDIVEGINDQGPDRVTLHTAPGCTMPSSRDVDMTGNALSDDCNTLINNNEGCSVEMTDTRSFDGIFNDKGGGFFAVERTDTFIKVWFWSRAATGIPSDVLNGATSVDTDNWGFPRAYFPSDDCDIPSFFGPHNIVIDLTFCGDWAGTDYAASGCPSTCIDFVNNNPSEFVDAYFDFEWLKIYG